VQQTPPPLMAVRKTLTHLTNHPTQPSVPQPHPGAEQARPTEAPLMAPLEVLIHQPVVAGDQGPLRQRPTALWQTHQKTL
jgi:hypothetical protein